MAYRLLLTLIVASSLLCGALSQDISNVGDSPSSFYNAAEGAVYRHLNSEALLIRTTTASFNVSTTSTLSRDIFDADEQITYATSIMRLEGTPDSSTGTYTFYVKNVTVNAARTSYTVFLEFGRAGATTFSAYTRIGLHVILIGSKFNRESHTLASGFARNSDLVPVTVLPGTRNSGQFNFTGTQGEPSPFTYIPTEARCGVSYDSGSARVEALGCALPTFFSFITGFQQVTTNLLSISSYMVATPNATISSINTVATDPSQPSYIYMQNANDTQVGPTIVFDNSFNNGTLNFVQFSMVFIGLRSFSPTEYPFQSSNADSFVMAVGYNDAITASARGLINVLQSPSQELNLNTYIQDSKFGSVFCGLQLIRGFDNLLVSFTEGFGSDAGKISVRSSATSNTQSSAATCLFFASRTRCLFDNAPLSGPYRQILTTGIPSAATAVDQFLVNPGFAIILERYQTNLYKASITNFAAKQTRTEITKNYSNPDARTELIFLFGASYSGTPLGPNDVTFIVTVGNQVVSNPLLPFILYTFHLPPGTTNIFVNITVLTKNTTTAASTGIQVFHRVIAFKNVLSASKNCDTKCAEVEGQTTGLLFTDSNPPQCGYCRSDLNEYYSNAFCVCRDNFYRNLTTRLCTPCSNPLCVTCLTGGSGTCTRCTDFATRVSGSCTCNSGFYRSSSLCLPCPSGCTECTSPTACSSCKVGVDSSNFDTRLDISQNCACKPGYFEVADSPICQRCSPSCLTCQGTATNCTSCDTLNNFVQQQGSCVCASGFYLLNNACVACSPICKTCAVASTYCLECPPLRELAGTNDPAFKTCRCSGNYVEVDQACVDATCRDIDPNCQTCTLGLNGPRTRECLNCVGNRIVIQGRCVCRPGFFEQNGQCVACSSGCQQCTNATTCLSCATLATNNNNGSCTCRDGSVLIEFSSSLYCQPCSSNCQNCASQASTCTSCKPGFVLSSGRCVCAPGTYGSDGVQCFPCLPNCQQCSDATSCNRCVNGFVFNAAARQCTLDCPAGTFNSGSECRSCGNGCTSCLSEFICNTCNSSFSLYAGSCRSTCPGGTYQSNGLCLACPNECGTCSNATNCLSCNNTLVLFAGQCITDCVAGTFFRDGSCRACDLSCQRCSGSASFCTACASPNILVNNSCNAVCPGVFINGVCTLTCGPGTFQSGFSCLPCDPRCLACSSTATNCTACATAFSSNGVCVDTCPSGTYPSARFCVSCDSSCRQCSGTASNCTECASGFFRLQNSCVRACPDGFFTNQANNSCVACLSGCATCTADRCLACTNSSLSPVGQTCQVTCPAGSTLVGDTCVCSFGVLHQNTCVSSCPAGFFANPSRVCTRCSSPCLECVTTSTSCLSCVSGFIFNATTRSCSAASQCPYGQYLDISGRCLRICQVGFLFSTGCVFRCPDNFQANDFGGCVQVSNPTFCSFPLFQQGSSCVAACSSGFWQNSVTRTCDRCFANCAQCFSSTFCISCNTGFTLDASQTSCVASLPCPANQVQYNSRCFNSCPLGSYQRGSVCVRSCPAQTFLLENLCYSTCPTRLATSDICVSVCPAGEICNLTN